MLVAADALRAAAPAEHRGPLLQSLRASLCAGAVLGLVMFAMLMVGSLVLFVLMGHLAYLGASLTWLTASLGFIAVAGQVSDRFTQPEEGQLEADLRVVEASGEPGTFLGALKVLEDLQLDAWPGIPTDLSRVTAASCRRRITLRRRLGLD